MYGFIHGINCMYGDIHGIHSIYAAYVWFIHGMVAWLIHLSTLVRESVLSFLLPFLDKTKIKTQKMTPPPFTACAKMHK